MLSEIELVSLAPVNVLEYEAWKYWTSILFGAIINERWRQQLVSLDIIEITRSRRSSIDRFFDWINWNESNWIVWSVLIFVWNKNVNWRREWEKIEFNDRSI